SAFRRGTAALTIVPFGLAVAAALAATDVGAADAGAADAGADDAAAADASVGDAGVTAGFTTDTNNLCGTFNFEGGINCQIQVSGGCTAQCTLFKFEVACSGHCSATANQTCIDTCGTQCVAQCDPKLLDCFNGCHAECDQPLI